jgi:rSAM/selenodomain-associated transferase 1
MTDLCLGLFANYCQPGLVKTRLAMQIGAERAATVYYQFVTTLLQRLGDCGEQRILAYAPSERGSQFATILPDGWQLQSQADGDLGLRMKSFFEQRFAAGCQRVVLLGSDSPNVPLEYVSQAFDLLRQHDVVLGPTEDGGYWLVGAAGNVPNIFAAIPWSTPQVWSATLAAIGAAGLSHAAVPTWYDVDQQNDLSRLISDLQQHPGREPPLDRLRDLLTQQEPPR